MADRFSRMPRTPEVHVFQAEISSGKQIETRRKPQHGTVIANSGQYRATFWQWRSAVTMTVFGTRFGGNFDLSNESFF